MWQLTYLNIHETVTLRLTEKDMWAASWQNQQNDCAPSEDSDQPGHPPVWSVCTCVQWVAKGPSFLRADSEDSDQVGRMPRLIWVFAGRTCHFVGYVMRRLMNTKGYHCFCLYSAYNWQMSPECPYNHENVYVYHRLLTEFGMLLYGSSVSMLTCIIWQPCCQYDITVLRNTFTAENITLKIIYN